MNRLVFDPPRITSPFFSNALNRLDTTPGGAQ
jgi:hypothetical protein